MVRPEYFPSLRFVPSALPLAPRYAERMLTARTTRNPNKVLVSVSTEFGGNKKSTDIYRPGTAAVSERLCRSGSFEHMNICMICRDPRLHFLHINSQQHRLISQWKDFAGEMFVRNTESPLKTPKVKFSPQLLKPSYSRQVFALTNRNMNPRAHHGSRSYETSARIVQPLRAAVLTGALRLWRRPLAGNSSADMNVLRTSR